MTDHKKLTDAETQTIFTRLKLAYGSAFAAKWQDIPLADVMDDWAMRLGAYTGDAEALSYALEHLPADFPPTAMAFAELCAQAAMWRSVREYEAARVPHGKKTVLVACEVDDGCGGKNKRLRRELVAVGGQQ